MISKLRYASAIAVLLALASGVRAEEAEKLVRMLIDASASNYSLIDSAQLEMHEVQRDRSMSEVRSEDFELPGGGSVKIVRRPLQEMLLNVRLQGESIRVDRHLGRNGSGQLEEIANRTDGKATQYVPALRTAWRRRPDSLPLAFPLDPRQCGVDEENQRLADLINDPNGRSVRREHVGGATVIVIEQAHPSGASKRWEFRSDSRFLPCRFLTTWEDGSLLQVVDYTYAPVLGGEALLVRKIRRRFFDKGVATDVKSESWRQEMVRTVIGEVLVNEPLEKEVFQLKLPPDTQIRDSTQQVAFGKLQSSGRQSQLPLHLNIGAIGLLALIIARRAYRRSHA